MGNVTSLKCRLVELVPVERLSRYLDGVASATGISVSLLGDGGEVIARASRKEGGKGVDPMLWDRLAGSSPDGPGRMEDGGGAVLVRAPVYHRGGRLCWAAACVEAGGPDDGRAMETVMLAAMHAGSEADSGYEVESLSGEVVRGYEELTLIFGLTARLGALVDVDEICHVIAEETGRVTGASDVLVQLADEEEGTLDTVYALGEHRDAAQGYRLGIKEGIVGSACVSHRPVLVCEVDEDKRHTGWPYPVRRLLAVPMMAEGRVIGAITSTDKKGGGEFESREAKLVSAIVSVAAIAIKNAQLYSEIKGLFEGFIGAAATAVESRDPTTAGHSSRVAVLTVELAKKVDTSDIPEFRDVKFSREDLMELHYAGLLHDFGKIGVRESVLVKGGKLYPEQLDGIRHRFGVIREQLVREAAERKLAVLLERGGDAYREFLPEVESGLSGELASLEGQLRVIETVNDPRVMLTELQEARTLGELTGRYYTGLGGGRLPWLTSQEYETLNVLRGSLTPDERAEVESHVTHSYNFLTRIPWTKGFRKIAEIVLTHHERLDGTGYPRGLKADDIPLQAKIMAVADVYDALTAWDRPYKAAVSVQKALFILELEAANGKLEPHLVQMFRDLGVYRAVEGMRPKAA